jgi:hypothetical protein
MDALNMKGSKTKANRAQVLLRGFSVPELNDVQKHMRTMNQAWGLMVAGIYVAKQSGTSVEDYATQIGDLFKYTWNRDWGFEGLVQGMLSNLESFRSAKDPAIEILYQDKNSIQFKWKINYKEMFSKGYVYNITFEEMNEMFFYLQKQIADYLGSSIEHEVDGEWLKITISRRGI